MKPNFPATLCLTLAAAMPSATAQEWVRADPVPGRQTYVFVYDRAEQRLLAIDDIARESWIFDGTDWRRVLPGGLETSFGPGRGVLFYGFDEAAGEAVLGVSGAFSTNHATMVNYGAGWFGTAIGAPDIAGAAVATDPVTGQLMTFGGRDFNSAAVDFTLLRSATGWNNPAPAILPPPRYDAAMALDRSRNRVVLFGGRNPGVLGDTWEWDGASWTQRLPAVSPSPRAAAMAYDPAAQRVVLLGGTGPVSTHHVDVWEWDGMQWSLRGNLPENASAFGYDDGTALHVATAPANVYRANGANWTPIWTDPGPSLNPRPAFAYDPVRGEALMVGGQVSGDTWTWDGTWQHRASGGPSVFFGGALAPLGNDMIYFGGSDQSNWPLFALFDETWSWNGQTWAQLQPPNRPAQRMGHAMVNVGSELLLFGGQGVGSALADTWSFNGQNWTQLQPAVPPPARHDHALAFDPIRQRTVMFGGADQSTSLQDTWVWNGNGWFQSFPLNVPFAGPATAAFDSAAGMVALPGFGNTFYWDGIDWNPNAPANVTAFGGQAAYDAVRQRLLLHSWSGLDMLTPTPATAASLQQTCGNRPDLRLLDRPSTGTSPSVHVEGQANSLAVVAYGLQWIQMNWAPGCNQFVIVDATLFGVLGANGRMDVPLVVPADPSLRGLEIYSQVAVLDGGPVFGLSLSNGLVLVVGD